MSAATNRNLLEILEQGSPAVIITVLKPGAAAAEQFCLTGEELFGNTYDGHGLTEEHIKAAQAALNAGVLQFTGSDDGGYCLAEPCFPEPRLIVLGGGHIAKPLVAFGSQLGFKVTVCDDRPAYANPSRFPDAYEVICESFERCWEHITLNLSAYVAIVTRGHRHDMDCFRKTALHEVAYVGMIGSKRRIAGLKAQLAGEGFPQNKLDQLQAPIGLDIGAVTPEEIALSIIAQVVSVRRKGNQGSRATQGSPELEQAVLEDLSIEKNEPRALVTIIGTKGSVPRKAGAKMVVWPDGRTLGSIGGGCSESEVTVIARDIIREGGYRVHHVDMTGDVAEDEGMVCGGIMEVLIQAIST